ncbi:hypothetical protein AVEN_210228-1 [Araneus ventricosus]|uniref:Uncharacterized protein n=1 Tax=Araneus ventricosus TaxID=182803 RepID=A0A4Y2FWY1_ARAVE|nr:hypothetical protein AVEN_210228-1 [Araneus ventricosus]
MHSIRDIPRDIGEMRDVGCIRFYRMCHRFSNLQKEENSAFQKVQGNEALHTKLLTFSDPNADPNAVADAGKFFFFPCFDFETPTIWILNATNLICRRSQNSLRIPCSSWLHFPSLQRLLNNTLIELITKCSNGSNSRKIH